MDVIFQTFEFRNLTVKNRIFHSNGTIETRAQSAQEATPA